MKLETMEGLVLLTNNEISIAPTKNADRKQHRKHIAVQHYYVQKLVNEGKITIK